MFPDSRGFINGRRNKYFHPETSATLLPESWGQNNANIHFPYAGVAVDSAEKSANISERTAYGLTPYAVTKHFALWYVLKFTFIV